MGETGIGLIVGGADMPKVWRIDIAGIPQPKGSFNVIRAGGKTYNVSPKRTEAWETLVKLMAQAAWQGPPWEGPVEVHLVFYLPPPKSARRGQRWVSKRPDVDKLTRAALDALAGIAYHDDSRVALVSASKEYAWARGPGVVIEVGALE